MDAILMVDIGSNSHFVGVNRILASHCARINIRGETSMEAWNVVSECEGGIGGSCGRRIGVTWSLLVQEDRSLEHSL